MQTTVAVVNGPGQDFELVDVELDEPREGEVLVRVVATGLCHTDITMRSFLPAEMFPNVFGHEGTGVVEQIGPGVTSVSPGDHVVLSFRSCQACAACRAGNPAYCEQTLLLNYMGMRIDGSTTMSRGGAPVFGSFFGQSSFGRHALVGAECCVVVDPALDLTRLAPFGCGYQTGVGTVLNVLQPGEADSLVVYGAGAVGLAAVAAAAATGVGTVVAVDLQAARLAEAERLGAAPLDATGLDPESVVQAVRDLTGGGASYAIDTTAVPAVVKQGMQALGSRGTLVALGLGAEEYPIDATDLLQGGKRLMSSLEGDSDPQVMVPRMIGMRTDGVLDLDPLVTTYDFADINTAAADVLAAKVVKPVLVW
ncbi:MAG: NAD(P)-dependent alcohol dehydrogenase [Nocardioides sp.]